MGRERSPAMATLSDGLQTQELAAAPEIGAETRHSDASSLASEFSHSISLDRPHSTYVASGRPVPAPTAEVLTPRKGRRDRKMAGNDQRSKRARRCHPPCCSCTRSSTCGRAPTAKQAGCSCYARGRRCTNCDCGDRCRNRSHITRATGSLGSFLRTRTLPPSTVTPKPAAEDDGTKTPPTEHPPNTATAATAAANARATEPASSSTSAGDTSDGRTPSRTEAGDLCDESAAADGQGRGTAPASPRTPTRAPSAGLTRPTEHAAVGNGSRTRPIERPQAEGQHEGQEGSTAPTPPLPAAGDPNDASAAVGICNGMTRTTPPRTAAGDLRDEPAAVDRQGQGTAPASPLTAARAPRAGPTRPADDEQSRRRSTPSHRQASLAEAAADLPGYVPTEADRLLDMVYRDHAHDNDGTHLSGGIAGDKM